MTPASSTRRVVGTFRDADDADRARAALAAGRRRGQVSENDEEDIEIALGSEELRRDDSAERPPDLTVAVDAVDEDEVQSVAVVLEDNGAEVVVVERDP